MRTLLLLAGCMHSPVGLAPSSGPIPEGSERGEWRSAERCDSHLFGLIPLDDPTMMQGLVADTGARADRPLLSVTIDRRDIFWLLGTTRCTRVSGWISMLPEAHVDPVSSVGQEQAETALFAIYSNLESTPTDAAQRQKDLRAVLRALEARVPNLVGQVMDGARQRPGEPVFVIIARILDSGLR